MNRLAPPLAALLALSACSAAADDEPVDAVSQSEAEALDEAASMLDEQRLPETTLPPAAEEQSDAQAPSPAEPTP